MSSWFSTNIVQTGRLPLFCFFVAFVLGFGFIRLSTRLIRAQVRWWPGNITPGNLHVHHMVFGVVFMLVGGVTGIVAPYGSLAWRSGAAALFGLGAALVLDEFALILHLRDVYWSSAGRLSVEAVFVAAGITMLLLLGIQPSRPGSPWARWRYQNKPHKRARAARRERRLRQPVVRLRVRLEDLVSGLQDHPDPQPVSRPEKTKTK